LAPDVLAPLLNTMLQDNRYAIRILRKSPGARAIAVMSLALAIAINTAVFGWIRGILLDPLPGVHRQLPPGLRVGTVH
jgi:hypothetical protein